MEKFTEIIASIDNLVWGIPLLVLIALVGILLSIRMKGLQFRKLGKAFTCLFRKSNGTTGEVSSFAALCIALSATLGTGNIIGVATAISLGGPGALFWMILMALIGMSTKYAEGFLAIKYREIGVDGTMNGGPFMYIEKGLGQKWKWLGILFAIFGAVAALIGIGTLTQVSGIIGAIERVYTEIAKPATYMIFGQEVSLVAIIIGLIVTILVGFVIIGGIKRIAKICELFIPVMAVTYITVCLIAIFTNLELVPAALKTIFLSAFAPQAVLGGALGITIKIAIQKGISRGIFSNEAGLGSEPIVAATSTSSDPVTQGLISMTGTFIDTVIVCLMTGIVVTMAGSWNKGLLGINITIDAFSQTLPFGSLISTILIALCILFFAFTTIIGWSVYGEKCLGYLFSKNKHQALAKKIYRYFYILFIFLGPYLAIEVIWNIADIFNGLMALPNLIAIFVLSGAIAKETNAYFKKEKTSLIMEKAINN